ncbi:hypothetical protein ACLK1S_17460 [Escherichia coli]
MMAQQCDSEVAILSGRGRHAPVQQSYGLNLSAIKLEPRPWPKLIIKRKPESDLRLPFRRL